MHRVMFPSIVRKYIDVFKTRAVTKRNAMSARVLDVDDNSLVRKEVMQNLIHLELDSRCGSPGGGGVRGCRGLVRDWTSGDYGVVRSMKECRDENQASYGTSIGSDYKSCLGSNSFPQ